MRPVVLLLTAIAVAGCGGAIRPDELQRGVESLRSSAAEGRLLAEQAAARRSKRTFTRVHSRAIGERVTHEAEKLHDAEAGAATERVKEQAVALAQAIGDALGQLQVAPGDAATARDSAAKLADAERRARRLSQQL